MARDLKESRDASARANLATATPFAPTGWKTVWLDHLSFRVTNYKQSASFYSNLLGWNLTYHEGSQQELMIDDVGDIIVRGGNPRGPRFNRTAPPKAELDQISFGISPGDADAVKADLGKRSLEARVDRTGHDSIHVAAYKSYHTTTPNGYDLQISFVTRQNRLALAHAVKPNALGK